MGVKVRTAMAVEIGAKRYSAKYTVEQQGGGYRFHFYCAFCGYHHSTGLISAAGETEALKIAERQAREFFNGCRLCGRWVCDRHFDMEHMVCGECADKVSYK